MCVCTPEKRTPICEHCPEEDKKKWGMGNLGKKPAFEDILEEGEMRWNTKHGEMLRLCPNGDIYVKGKLTENDKEVVEGMRQFLKSVHN